MLMAALCYWMGGGFAVADFPRIDLEVESIQIQPGRPHAGEPLTVLAVMRNNGSQSADSFDIAVRVHQGQTLVRAIEKVPVLSSLPRGGVGQSIPVQIGKLPEGDYQVTVEADPENNLTETTEENNARAENFHVSSAGSYPSSSGYAGSM